MADFYGVINHAEDTNNMEYLKNTIESLLKQPPSTEISQKTAYTQSSIDAVLAKGSWKQVK